MAEPLIPTPQDEQLVLQAAGTLTTTGNGAALDLGAGFAPGGGGQPMQAIVPVTALTTGGAAPESYKFKLQDSADNVTYRDASPEITLAAQADKTTHVLGAFVRARYVRLARTVAGTAPSITLGKCYLNPQAVR